MKRYLIYIVSILLFSGCGSTKTSTSGSMGNKSDKQSKANIAKVKADADGRWVLVAPNGSVVAPVYVENGSSVPDHFQNGYIRIVGTDGQQIGFANEQGQITITPSYKAATRYSGTVACVVPFSQSSAATDDAAVGVLDGNELWGVIDTDGRYFYNPVYHREWNDKLAAYVYSGPNCSFWVSEDGSVVKVK